MNKESQQVEEKEEEEKTFFEKRKVSTKWKYIMEEKEKKNKENNSFYESFYQHRHIQIFIYKSWKNLILSSLGYHQNTRPMQFLKLFWQIGWSKQDNSFGFFNCIIMIFWWCYNYKQNMSKMHFCLIVFNFQSIEGILCQYGF